MSLTILHISGYGTNSNGGGIKTYIKNLLLNFGVNRYKYFLVAKNGIPGMAGEIIIPGNSISFIIKTFIRCITLKPTVIHSHANWYCLFPALLYKLISKTKVVHTLHSVPEEKYDLLTRLFFKLLLRCCDHVNFVSVFLKDYYSNTEGIILKNTSVIYPGAGHAMVKYAEQQKQQFLSDFCISQDAFIILAQGLTSHILKYKGACLLLRIFAILRSEYPHLVLLITKQGKYLDDLRRFADELKISDSVIFTRNLDDPLLAHAVAGIYAHITFGEGGISFSILEAMASGNPVIATNTGGIPELLTNGKTALLTDTTVQAVYYALKQLIEDTELSKNISSKAKNHVDEHFKWTTTAQRFETIYSSLITNKP